MVNDVPPIYQIDIVQSANIKAARVMLDQFSFSLAILQEYQRKSKNLMANDVSPIYQIDIVQLANIKAAGVMLDQFSFLFSLYSYNKNRRAEILSINRPQHCHNSFIHSYTFILLISLISSNMNMWTNGYNIYGNALQRDTQPNTWFNQDFSGALNSKSLAPPVKAPKNIKLPC